MSEEQSGSSGEISNESGDISQPAPVADGVERSVDPRAVILNRIVGAIVTLFLAASVLVGGLILFMVSPLPSWAHLLIIGGATAITVAWGWLSQLWPSVEHRHIRYRVDDRGIEIGRGVFWRATISVPRSRVQHTDVSQGPLERRFDLATLQIFTAGTEHSKVDLSGLEYSTALRIRDHLVQGGEDDAV